METIIKMELPLKRVPKTKQEILRFFPWYVRWFEWLYSWSGGSIQEFGGRRVNKTRRFYLFRWHILTIHRNEYHDRSDAERADEYLREWSKCEKELRGLRLLLMGDSCNAHVTKVIKESLGIDLDEGTIL